MEGQRGLMGVGVRGCAMDRIEFSCTSPFRTLLDLCQWRIKRPPRPNPMVARAVLVATPQQPRRTRRWRCPQRSPLPAARRRLAGPVDSHKLRPQRTRPTRPSCSPSEGPPAGEAEGEGRRAGPFPNPKPKGPKPGAAQPTHSSPFHLLRIKDSGEQQRTSSSSAPPVPPAQGAPPQATTPEGAPPSPSARTPSAVSPSSPVQRLPSASTWSPPLTAPEAPTKGAPAEPLGAPSEPGRPGGGAAAEPTTPGPTSPEGASSRPRREIGSDAHEGGSAQLRTRLRNASIVGWILFRGSPGRWW